MLWKYFVHIYGVSPICEHCVPAHKTKDYCHRCADFSVMQKPKVRSNRTVALCRLSINRQNFQP
jgi:hypothetical protein